MPSAEELIPLRDYTFAGDAQFQDPGGRPDFLAGSAASLGFLSFRD
jgi:hypothetical protein